MKKIVIIFAVIIVVLLGVLIFIPAKAPEGPPGSTATSTIPQPAISADGHVSVTTPHAGDVVSSPVTITGTVTGGGWFFEASFPVKVIDADGAVLGRGQAQAHSDWMTTGTVPFAATITFTAPHSGTGTIVLAKDNPSGMPQNDMSLAIPVRFAAVTKATSTVGTSTFKYDSGVTGTITLGPTCPVERIPPDPACAPKPYPTRIVVYQKNSTTVAAMAAPDQKGFYKIPLPPGNYTLSPQGGNPLPRCAPMEVTVAAGVFQTLDLQCDTGIR
jgi:hypothetical protein